MQVVSGKNGIRSNVHINSTRDVFRWLRAHTQALVCEPWTDATPEPASSAPELALQANADLSAHSGSMSADRPRILTPAEITNNFDLDNAEVGQVTATI